MPQTFLREHVLVGAAVLVLVAIVIVPFALDTNATVNYLNSRGLTIVTDPIDPSTAPVLFGVAGVGLLLAVAGLLMTLRWSIARWLAILSATAKAVILLGLGAAGISSYATLPPNTDGLVAGALLIVAIPLIIGGLFYVAVTLFTRARRVGWRLAAVVLDGFVAWTVARQALGSASLSSSPFYTGTATHLIYTAPQYGTWPLVQAGLLSLLVMAGTVAVVVNALRSHEPATETADPTALAPARESG